VTNGVREFIRAYWTRGEPGRALPRSLTVRLYQLWLLAFLLKSLGAAWDISWHFMSLRDNPFILPHDVNLVGEGIAIALIIFHTYTGYGMDKASLRLTQGGMILFLVAAPLDEINHRINGLDITTWSPSHFLLFLGTGICMAGVTRGAMVNLEKSAFRTFALLAMFFYIFEDAMFPNGQQEYGIFEIMAWDAGKIEASSDLLTFLANEIHRAPDRAAILQFALPIPNWFYPLWGMVAAALVLIVARRVIGLRWTATAIVGAFLAYKSGLWLIFVAAGFTKSAVPFWLIVVGVAVDVAFAIAWPWFVRVLVGSVLVVGLGHLAMLAQDQLLVLPPVDHLIAPVSFVVLALLWALGERWWPPYQKRWMDRLGRPRTPAPLPAPS
jgi:hypothetical protein